MPNISSAHHYLVTIPDSVIKEAIERDKEERLRARQKGWKVKLRHPEKLEWGGYVFENAFASVFPDLIPVSKKYGLDLKDFKNPYNGIRYELKCRVTDIYPFDDDYYLFINKSQVDNTESDIFVIGYYFTKSPFIRLCGWLYTNQIENRGLLLNKGKQFPRTKRTVKATCYSVPYKELNSIHLLNQ